MKIHIYFYHKSFHEYKNKEEIIRLFIGNHVVHEIFHYFISSALSNKYDTLKDEFGKTK